MTKWYTNRAGMQPNQEEFLTRINLQRGILHKISRMYADTPEDREDLKQEIVLQLWKSYAAFKGNSQFSSWMYRVALNTAILYLKKEKRRVHTVELAENFQKPSIETNSSERLSIFYAACKQLSQIEKAIVFLYMEGLSHKEIGENLTISEGNARVKLNRTKNKLQEIIKNKEI